MRFNELTIFNPTIPTWDCVSLRVHRTSETIRRKDLQREMNEQFELITVTISLAAAEMNENNCRTAIGKPAFSGVMQSMSRHVILPRTFGKKGRNSSMLCAKTFMNSNKTSFGMYLLQLVKEKNNFFPCFCLRGAVKNLLFYLLFIMIVFQVQNVQL